MHALARVPVLLKPRVIVAPLMVEHDDVGALADGAEVTERARLRGNGTAVHAGPDAVGAAGGTRGLVVQVPDRQAARVVPPNPIAVGGVVPVRGRRKVLAATRLEQARAVVAVADAAAAEPRPTVVGETFRV